VLIDSHCHLADDAFEGDRHEVLDRAWQAGVAHVVAIGESRTAVSCAQKLAASDPRISITAGVHPHDASSWDDGAEAWLREILGDERIVATGEIGLDYHYDHSPRDVQRGVFDAQMGIAAEVGLPVVVHAREADADIAAILRNHPGVVAILHSFSSGTTLLQAGLELQHYVSFSGMVTFRNWRLDDAVRETPLDRLLVETDAPYLAPVPFRGKRNEPAFVRQVADRVAEVRHMPANELIAVTGANARRVFGPRLEPT
jgi:TatD DNase family protein